MFENLEADIKRFSDSRVTVRTVIRGLLSQGFHAIFVYRFFHWFGERKIPTQPARFLVERLIEIITGISIPAECAIGKGFRIHHFGGVILHPSAQIGENCTFYHGVTVGDKGGYGRAAIIGNNVMIGAGAKIIGEIRIGDNCKIGANAVVSEDIPAGAIAFGNPAQVLIKPDNKNGN